MFKSLFKSRSSWAASVALIALFSFFPEQAMAQQSWADVFASGGQTIEALKKLIVVVAYMLGVGLFVLGLWLMYKDGKEENRGHMKNGVIAMIIGTLLLIFPTTIGWTVGSLGGDESVDSENFNTNF